MKVVLFGVQCCPTERLIFKNSLVNKSLDNLFSYFIYTVPVIVSSFLIDMNENQLAEKGKQKVRL